jgi:transposase
MGFREFREVSDFEWDVVRPFLPPRSRVGWLRADDRMVLNGILYVLTTGSRWSRVGCNRCYSSPMDAEAM